jgi:hypothetical protein
MIVGSGPRLPVPLFAALLLLGVIHALAIAQTRREVFDPDGSFWIQGKPPRGLEDFSGINLNAKRNHDLPPSGVDLTNGTQMRYKSLAVTPDKLRFTTIVVRGVSYSFRGRFLKGGVLAAADLDQDTPVLEGILTKFKKGQKVVSANLKFTYFGGT